MSLYSELKRRNVIKVTIAYVVSAWLVMQVAAETGQALEDKNIVPVPGSTMSLDNSIAVLPFVNTSDDASNEYFSEGLSEELLNLLAKIPELRVISRTSAFSFKGRQPKIVDIARELKVGHVLEGSVRKAGDRVRITVRLIDARFDTETWSEIYDRQLLDIFAIQNNIAAMNDLAFAWLEKAVEYGDGGLYEIAANSLFANIHSDPRWPAFLRRIGMAPEQLDAVEFELQSLTR